MRILSKAVSALWNESGEVRLCGLRGVRQMLYFHRHVRCNSRVLVAAAFYKPKLDDQVTLIRITFSLVTFSQELR